MKKIKLKNLVLTSVAAGSLTFATTPVMAAVQVNPIPGINSNMIKGVDISMLPEMEKHGAKFYDTDGTEMDCLAVMKKHGVNWIRVRIWNDPSKNPGGGGDNPGGRAPYGARGLKSTWVRVVIVGALSRPVWGAWIEISRATPRLRLLTSRPVWGAWIEMTA